MIFARTKSSGCGGFFIAVASLSFLNRNPAKPTLDFHSLKFLLTMTYAQGKLTFPTGSARDPRRPERRQHCEFKEISLV